MTFTKAIVLSPADFRGLVADLVDIWARDYRDEMSFREFVESEIDMLLEEEGVEEMVVFLKGGRVRGLGEVEAIEIWDGEGFVELMEREGYPIEDEEVLRELGYERFGGRYGRQVRK